MLYSVVPTDNFIKEARVLARKHSSLKSDLIDLIHELEENPIIGTALGGHVYKIRMAVTAKRKGKSGGARVIYYVYYRQQQVFLLSIYDKSDKENITDIEIKKFIRSIPF